MGFYVTLDNNARSILESKMGMCLLPGFAVRRGNCIGPRSSSVNDSPLGAGGLATREQILQAADSSGLDVNALPLMAVEAKRAGDLDAANKMYTMFMYAEEPYRMDYLWPWAKIMLLAKSFRDAELILHYLYFYNVRMNLLRRADGEYVPDRDAWGITPLSFDAYSPLSWLRQCSSRGFSTKEETEAAIKAYGGSDYWQRNFSMSYDDWRDFQRWFQ